jgi:hypothetical protein
MTCASAAGARQQTFPRVVGLTPTADAHLNLAVVVVELGFAADRQAEAAARIRVELAGCRLNAYALHSKLTDAGRPIFYGADDFSMLRAELKQIRLSAQK